MMMMITTMTMMIMTTMMTSHCSIFVCFDSDVWKTRQCMDMSLSGCSMEETHHVREVLESRMRPMIPDSCQSKLKFSECALHFAVMAQKILKVSEEMMPKGELVLYISMNKIIKSMLGWMVR